jgi:ATPase family associated with various cellular activities (AAA)
MQSDRERIVYFKEVDPSCLDQGCTCCAVLIEEGSNMATWSRLSNSAAVFESAAPTFLLWLMLQPIRQTVLPMIKFESPPMPGRALRSVEMQCRNLRSDLRSKITPHIMDACIELIGEEQDEALAVAFKHVRRRLAIEMMMKRSDPFRKLATQVKASATLSDNTRAALLLALAGLAAVHGDSESAPAFASGLAQRCAAIDAKNLSFHHADMLSVLSDWSVDFYRADGPASHEICMARWLGEAVCEPVAAATPATVIVAPHLGKQDDNSHDRDQTLRRYDRLAEPLPLCGNFETHADGTLVITATLLREFPWFAPVIEAIDNQLRLSFALSRPVLRLRPLLLVGPPGCGKSRFLNRLAALSGCGFGMLNAAGSSDNRLLAGTARGWSSAQPSWPAQVMLRSACANPVLMVDEIDKVGLDPRNGLLTHTLLSMLEGETSRQWLDECLITPLDLSHINWALTANDLKPINKPLLSRLQLFAVGLPETAHFPALYRSILDDIAERNSCTVAHLPALGHAMEAALEAGFARSRNPRRLRQAIEEAMARAIRPPERAPMN